MTEPSPSVGDLTDQMNGAMGLMLRIMFSGAVALGAARAGAAMAQDRAQDPHAQMQEKSPTSDWRQQAKQQFTPAEMDDQLARVTRSLQLSPDQQEKAKHLIRAYFSSVNSILDENRIISQEAFTTQARALSQENREQINALLTEHQLDLMRAMVGRLGKGNPQNKPESDKLPPHAGS